MKSMSGKAFMLGVFWCFSLSLFALSSMDGQLTSFSLDTLPEDPVGLGLPTEQDSIDLGYILGSTEAKIVLPQRDSIENKSSFVYALFKEDYPNPRKAFFFALAVPGGGQLYNKRYWKLPFVYALIGGAGYGIYTNTQEYRRFRTAYESRVKGEPDEFLGIITSLQTLKNISDSYRSSMELSYVFLLGGYLFTAAEALVDAHLKTFDVSEDLSLQLRPVFYGSSLGIAARLSF
jgi:hypothetical protein